VSCNLPLQQQVLLAASYLTKLSSGLGLLVNALGYCNLLTFLYCYLYKNIKTIPLHTSSRTIPPSAEYFSALIPPDDNEI